MNRNTSRAFSAYSAFNGFGALCAVAMIMLTGCGADRDASAGDDSAARTAGNVQLVDACELIVQAQLESVLGKGEDNPTSANFGFDDDSATKYSGCAYAGANDAILLKLTYPYRAAPATSEEWAAKVHEDYTSSLRDADDPSAAAVLAGARTHPLDGLGDVAAWIDVREFFGQVILHAIKDGRQRTHLELYASDLETARQVTAKLLEGLP